MPLFEGVGREWEVYGRGLNKRGEVGGGERWGEGKVGREGVKGRE